jgi:hypothetical protein
MQVVGGVIGEHLQVLADHFFFCITIDLARRFVCSEHARASRVKNKHDIIDGVEKRAAESACIRHSELFLRGHFKYHLKDKIQVVIPEKIR